MSDCNPKMIFLNAAIIRLHFTFDLPYHKCMPLPQAWSLSVEILFYVAVPFSLILFRGRFYIILSIFSFASFINAYLGVRDLDAYGFRHISGTFFMFALGMTLFMTNRIAMVLRASIYSACIAMFIYTLTHPELASSPLAKDILLGILIGVPVVALLGPMKGSKTESLLGNLSYGIFLNHFMILLLLSYFEIRISSMGAVSFTLVTSIALSALTFYGVERPVIRLRYRLRRAIEGDRSVRPETPPEPKPAGPEMVALQDRSGTSS